MIRMERQWTWWKKGSWSVLRHVAVPLLVAIPAALYLHPHFAPVPKLTYDVQRLPFEPLIDDEECVIMIMRLANEGRVPLTEVGFMAKVDGRVHHCGTTERGRDSHQIDIRTSGAETELYVDLGRLPIGGRVAVGVISSGGLAGQPAVVSDEVIGVRAGSTGSRTGYTMLGVAACAVVLLGSMGYLLLFFIQRVRATAKWARILADYVLANRCAARDR